MFEHFWPKIDGFWQHSQKPEQAKTSLDSAQVTKFDHDSEFRCWNCGEYIDIHSEICPHCGHSPDPLIEDFTRKFEV